MNFRVFSFLRLFLPVALLILLGTYFLIDSHRKSRLDEIRADESFNVRIGAAILDRRMQIVLRDLLQLARNIGADQNRRPDPGNMERHFINFLRAKPVFDQVAWLDVHGQEVVRVDLNDGQPVALPKGRLAKQSERKVFQEAIKLSAGQIYISPMVLTGSSDAIEKPYKPILGLAMPFLDQKGEKTGILTLRYLSNEMFEELEAVTRQANDRLMLLNADSYFLRAPERGDEWGFMLNEPTRNLASRFPESWVPISHQESGQFIDHHGLWTFQTVHPIAADIHRVGETSTQREKPAGKREGGQHWQVVTHLTPDQLAKLAANDESKIYLFMILLLGLFAAGAFSLVRANLREGKAEHRFKIYFERAMVGMAMTAPDRRWIEVNPALCRMLGYSRDVLLTKSLEELTPPEDLQTSEALFARALRGDIEGYELEKRYIRADGQWLNVSVSTQVVRKTDGSADYLFQIIEDISSRVMAERQKLQSLETLRRFVDHLPGLAYIKDYETRVLVANRQFQEMLGLKPENLLGRRTDEIFAGELGQKLVADDLRILAAGSTETLEETMNGRIYETIKFSIPHDTGQPELGGITMDITERKKAEKMLELQARRAMTLLDLPQKSVDLSEVDFMRYVLDQIEMLTESQIGFMHFIDPGEESLELVAWSTRTLEKYCQAGFDQHYPISKAGIWADAARYKIPVVINDYASAAHKKGLPDGHSALTRLISVPVIEEAAVRMMTGVGNKPGAYTDTDVETVQLLGNETWRIVRQQRVEKALRIANQVVNASPVVCFRWAATEGWPVVFVSENVVQWGYTAEALQAGNPPFAELVHPDDLARIAADVAAKTAAGLSGYEQQYRIVTQNNQSIWVVDRTIVRRNVDGEVEFYDGVLTDITESKMQQLALAENLAEQRKLNKRLEEAHNQLLQSEKMASIGQLAAGIAHELNNPIGFVHSNLGTLDGYLRDLMDIIDAHEALANTEAVGSPGLAKINVMKEERDFKFIRQDIGQLLLESKDGLARVRKIVQDLKNFSHVSEQEWQWADLHQGLDSTLNIVWNELKYKCKVIKQYGELPKVYCMISQLNQVFMNLLVNASHAIETKGTITLRTFCLSDEEVCIEISDTGKGIAPEHLQRIFEPFFTTKPVGKGTGLGLSLSYGIVDNHHGRISVESVLGQGSTFRITLPVNQNAGQAGESTEAIA